MERLTYRDENGEAFIVLDENSKEWCVSVNEPSYAHTIQCEAVDKLADYEDKEEQGLLRVFHCKVGDTIYVIPSKVNYDLNVLNEFGHLNKVHEQKVHSIELYGDSRYLLTTCEGMCSVVSDSYEETWFLTRAEAEEALAKMGGK